MPSVHTTLWKACARLVATRWGSLWAFIHNQAGNCHAHRASRWKAARFSPPTPPLTRIDSHRHLHHSYPWLGTDLPTFSTPPTITTTK